MGRPKKEFHRCRGCRYVGVLDDQGFCDYICQTGKMRKNPDGTPSKFSTTEPCPCYKPSTRKHPQTKMPRGPYPDVPVVKTPPPGQKKPDPRKGYRASWDVEKAKRMYLEGRKLDDIAEACGVTKKTIQNYRQRYGWIPGK